MIDSFDTTNSGGSSADTTTTQQHSSDTHTISFAADATATHRPPIDFGPVEDLTHGLIKVVGVGGGGCNAVRNMYTEGIVDVSFAVCNTDSKSLSKSPIPVKLPIGYLGAGGNPEEGRKAAQSHIDEIKKLFTDGTQMVFITAGMGGGTGTGAAPVVAGVAKSMGLLTIGIVTIPFYFEKRRKIVKALKGVEEMRKNVDAILIVNNERICDIYSDSDITVKESFKRADQILCNATKSISELITIEGDINLDFKDVESTMRSGGGAIMAMGRASGERRVEKAIVDALDSPLLYGNDISKAKRLLFNIYTSEKSPLHVNEMNEVDAFMDGLNPEIEVIWGVSDDDTLGEDAKVTILATGFDDEFETQRFARESHMQEDEYYSNLIAKLYKPMKKSGWSFMDKSNMTNGNATGTDYSNNGNGDNGSNTNNTATSNSDTSNDDNDTHNDDADNTASIDNSTPNDEATNTTTTNTTTTNTPNDDAEKPKRHEKSLLERLKEKLWKMGLLVEDINNPTE